MIFGDPVDHVARSSRSEITMLYVITYEIGDVTGPGGCVSTSRQEVLELAVAMAELGLNELDDLVNVTEWLNLSGDEDEPRKLLKATDPDEVANAVQQIGDKLQLEKMGHINLFEHHHLFEVVQVHDVESWCSAELKAKIQAARGSYSSAIRALADEWVNA